MGILSAITSPIVYTDANIFIYAFEGVPAVASQLQIFFEAVAVGKIKAVTSELSLAEVLVKPIADGRHEIRVLYERALRDSAELAVIPVTRNVLSRCGDSGTAEAPSPRCHSCGNCGNPSLRELSHERSQTPRPTRTSGSNAVSVLWPPAGIRAAYGG